MKLQCRSRALEKFIIFKLLFEHADYGRKAVPYYHVAGRHVGMNSSFISCHVPKVSTVIFINNQKL